MQIRKRTACGQTGGLLRQAEIGSRTMPFLPPRSWSSTRWIRRSWPRRARAVAQRHVDDGGVQEISDKHPRWLTTIATAHGFTGWRPAIVACGPSIPPSPSARSDSPGRQSGLSRDPASLINHDFRRARAGRKSSTEVAGGVFRRERGSANRCPAGCCRRGLPRSKIRQGIHGTRVLLSPRLHALKLRLLESSPPARHVRGDQRTAPCRTASVPGWTLRLVTKPSNGARTSYKKRFRLAVSSCALALIDLTFTGFDVGLLLRICSWTCSATSSCARALAKPPCAPRIGHSQNRYFVAWSRAVNAALTAVLRPGVRHIGRALSTWLWLHHAGRTLSRAPAAPAPDGSCASASKRA